MKQSLITIFVLLGAVALFSTGCDLVKTDNTPTQNNSTSPMLSEVTDELFDFPNSMTASEIQQSALLLKSNIATETEEQNEDNIFGAYKLVPLYIGFADAAKKHVKAFIYKINKHNIPDNITVEEDGLTIHASSIDTTILGAEQKFIRFNIHQGDKLLLRLNFWKNARNQYRGNFYYYETEKAGEIGNRIFVHFNGHNNELLGKRMVVTFYQTPENLATSDDPNGPQIVRIRAVKKANKIFTTGISYHPTFIDEDGFWETGAYVYAFQVAANTLTNNAVMKASFAPAGTSREKLFSEYTLDKVVAQKLYEAFINELDTAEGDDAHFKTMVLWSIETNQPIATDKYLEAISHSPSKEIMELTLEEYKQFLELNKFWLLAEGHGAALLFIKLKQPIFFNAYGMPIGSATDESEGTDFGIGSDELESEALVIIEPEEVVTFDPDSEEEIDWKE